MWVRVVMDHHCYIASCLYTCSSASRRYNIHHPSSSLQQFFVQTILCFKDIILLLGQIQTYVTMRIIPNFFILYVWIFSSWRVWECSSLADCLQSEMWTQPSWRQKLENWYQKLQQRQNNSRSPAKEYWYLDTLLHTIFQFEDCLSISRGIVDSLCSVDHPTLVSNCCLTSDKTDNSQVRRATNETTNHLSTFNTLLLTHCLRTQELTEAAPRQHSSRHSPQL